MGKLQSLIGYLFEKKNNVISEKELIRERIKKKKQQLTELEKYLALAKSEYHYQDALTAKIEFEKEGRKKIEEKVQSIMNLERQLMNDIPIIVFMEKTLLLLDILTFVLVNMLKNIVKNFLKKSKS